MENYQLPQSNIYAQSAMQQPIQPVAPQAVTQPAAPSGSPTASAVNIIIQNPTANPAPAYPSYPANYYMQQPIYNMAPNNAYPQAAPVAQPVPQAAAPVSAAPIEKEVVKPEETEEKKTGKTKNVVQLTDDYIKSLENYLRDPKKDVRVMAAKELSKRFTEDDSRKNDAALNSLLNLVIQDKAVEIRSLGLALLSGRLAQGDETTVKILKEMQNSKEAYGQDALSATDALLKMSGEIVKIPDNSPDKPELTDDQKKAKAEKKAEERKKTEEAKQAEEAKAEAAKQAEEAKKAEAAAKK